jgi:hypothetical protein
MKKYELKVVQDESPESPREWDNVTTMVCIGKYGYLGDKHEYKRDNFDSWEELKEQICEDYNVFMIKPLYVYEHGGITISTSPNSCRFDTSFVGFIFIEEKNWISMMGEDMDRSDERLERIIDGDIETYDKYLQGEVYQYEVYEVEECSLGHTHKTYVEGCGGYFDEEDCRSEGERIIDSLLEKVPS